MKGPEENMKNSKSRIHILKNHNIVEREVIKQEGDEDEDLNGANG